MHNAKEILEILDDCNESYDFPMLDNGYIYLADTRLTALRGEDDWCLTIETVCVFQRSPDPADAICTWIYYFGNCLTQPSLGDFVSREAWQRQIDEHPYDQSHVVHPVGPLDTPLLGDDGEGFSNSATKMLVRDEDVAICRDPTTYAEHGILLRTPDRVETHELLRLLVCTKREQLLATRGELWEQIDRPKNSLDVLLKLDAWRHPDVAEGECPSQTEAFRMIAEAIATNDATRYAPTEEPNTDWTHWPTGGTM